ncbi:MAG: hypothetical protein U9P36_07875 [Thermodesulfobacteriota bacterium]|nr:hypothetical protein [Thermodesulfobacteriota bacterium]
MHAIVEKITQRIVERSKKSRQGYLERIEEAKGQGAFRNRLPCSNFAQGDFVSHGAVIQKIRAASKKTVNPLSSAGLDYCNFHFAQNLP